MPGDPVSEEGLAQLAEKIRDRLHSRGMHVPPGPERDELLGWMNEYMRLNGYEFTRLTPAQTLRRATAHQLRENTAALEMAMRQNDPAIAVAEAERQHVADVRDALKWAAAFSAAALLFIGSAFRSRPDGTLVPFAEAQGLAVGAVGFLVSIASAGLFLVTVDLPMADLLRVLVARVHLDQHSYRNALQAYADAGAANARDDDGETEAALDRAQRFLDDVQGRGNFPGPAPSLALLEHLWLALCLGGFGLGLAGALGDFIAKIPR